MTNNNILSTNDSNDNILKCIVKITLLLAGIQAVRILLKKALFTFVEHTIFTDSLYSAMFMLVMTTIFIIICKKKDIPISLLPKKLTIIYIVAVCIFVLVIVSCLFFSDKSANSLFLLFYSAFITPFFEETLFRGYAWNKLEGSIKNKWIVYLIITIMFALWHFGYYDTVLWRMSLKGSSEGLANIMLFKAITGMCYGVVLGFARLKSKNALIPMLLHGALNAFLG